MARWNGTAWSGLGSSGDINAIVHDAVIYKGSLHIAGEFENAGGDPAADMVATWSGTAWVGLPVQGATGGANGTGSPRDAASPATDYATALEVQENGAGTSDDVLLVGGRFINGINNGTAAGFTLANTRNIATWNGSAWASVAASSPYPGSVETDMAVRDIVSIGSDIYLGGYRSTYSSSRRTYMFLRFQSASSAWDRPVSTVSQSFMGTGFGIFTMTAIGTDIYLGGTFSGLASVAENLAVYSTTGNSFSAFNDFAAQFGTGAVVRAITPVGAQLFVAGSFPGVTGTSGGVARWTGTSWQGIGRNAPSVVNAVLADMDFSGSSDRVFVASPGADIGGVAAADGLATLALDPSSALDSLTVSAGSLAPAFDPSVTSYTLSIPNASSSVDFTVLASSSGAAVKRTNATGTIALSTDADSLAVGVGATENVTFTVASLSGTETAYTVAVTRAAASTTTVESTTTVASTTTAAPVVTTTTVASTTTAAPSQQQPPDTTVAPTATTSPSSGGTSTGSSSSGGASTPSTKVGKTTSGTSLAKSAGVSVPSGAKVSVKVASSSSKYCKVSGTSVKALKAGTCKVTVTVTPKKGKATTKTVTLKVT